jgi:hypothetical protein
MTRLFGHESWCRIAGVLTNFLALFSAAGLASAAPSTWRAECIGYHVMQVPGDIEYAVQRPPLERDWNPKFSDGLGVWRTAFDVDLGSRTADLVQVSISTEVTQRDLEALASARNKALQRTKDRLLELADAAKKFGSNPTSEIEAAKRVSFFKPFNSGMVSVWQGSEGLNIDALIEDRIIGVDLNLVGTPQQTLDAFLKRYHSREPFKIPQEAGVCLPYAFITGESQPASVGISMRLKDRPDIVIYLRDGKDLSVLEPPKSAKAYLSRAVQNFFYGATLANPLDGDLKPFHSITIDGREGLGGFGIVTRQKGSGPEAFNNEANQDKDWAYLAYVPADKKAARGMSSDLVFKVERFGRFAKQPMSEKEFRVLVKTIAASIKRRPGAWVAR